LAFGGWRSVAPRYRPRATASVVAIGSLREEPAG
jgi:hypothetical protein